MIRKVIVSGYCPESEDYINIQVSFAEIRIPGKLTADYKKVSYSCEYGSEHGCRTCGPTGSNCPLFRTASL